MFGGNISPFRKGKPLRSRELENLKTLGEGSRRLNAGTGLAQTTIAGISSIRLVNADVIRHALTTTTIAASSGDTGETEGSGSVQFYTDEAGTLTDSELPDIPVFNWTGSAIGEGVKCLVAQVNSVWVLIATDCSGTGSGSGSGSGTTTTTVPPTMTPTTGGQDVPYTTVSSATMAGSSDAGFYVNATSGSFVVTLPPGSDGRTFRVINVSSNTNTFSVVARGSDLIVPISLPLGGTIGTGQYQSIKYRYVVASTGVTGWYVVA